MTTRQLDEIDLQLIALLKSNARESTSNLAKRVGLSRPAVHERVKRLERDQIIRGFTILTAQPSRETLRAHVLIHLDPKVQDRIEETLSRYPQIRQLTIVSGEYDLVCELAVRDAAELDSTLGKMGKIPGVEKTITLVILATPVAREG
jgi:DNA-binding Lrp family transcriptional regulator